MSDLAAVILLLVMSAFCICSGIYYYFNTEKALQKIINSCPKQSNNKISRLFFYHYRKYLGSPVYAMQLKATGLGGLIMGIIMLYLALTIIFNI